MVIPRMGMQEKTAPGLVPARFLLFFSAVRTTHSAGFLRLATALLLALLLVPARASAYDVGHGVSANTETLTLSFDGTAPQVDVQRVGVDRLAVVVSGGGAARSAQFSGSRLIQDMTPNERGFTLRMKTNEFGFIRIPGKNGKVLIQIFRDPIGARWQPAGARAEAKKPEPKAEPKKAEAKAEPKKPESKKPEAAPQPKAEAKDAAKAEAKKPEPAKPDPKAKNGKQAKQPQTPQPALPTPPVPPAQPSPPRAMRAPSSDPFALRAPVQQVGPDAAPAWSTSLTPAQPEPGQPGIPSSGGSPEVRMRAVKKTLVELMAEAKDLEKKAEGAVQAVEQAVGQEAEHLYKDAPLAQQIDKDMAAMQGQPAAPGQTTPEAAAPAGNATGPDGKSILTAEEKRAQYDQQLQEGLGALQGGKYKEAVDKLRPLGMIPDVPADIKEEALYNLAQTYFTWHKDDLQAHFQEITGAFERAMNFKPNGDKVPGIMLSLGLVNMKVGNVPEATAYFNLLKKRYPNDENIPLIDYYWGQYYFDQGDFQQAADRYQNLVQNYPDSSVVREASVGLAQALDKLGYYKQAAQIVDYIDKRFPRYYVESPEFLRLSGSIANNLSSFEKAKSDYWAFYNLDPQAPDMDVILARVGDIYLRQDRKEAAKDVYTFVANAYGDKQGGLVAKMRMAEEGIYDDPSVGQMFGVFDRPFTMRPVEVYTQIVEKFPDSALAPLAQAKLAMWNLFNNRPDDALSAVETFFKKYPKNPLAERVEEAGLAAFERSAKESLEQENWPRIVGMWERFPFLGRMMDKLTPDTRMAVAMAYWKENRPTEALVMAGPFLAGMKQGDLSDMALSLALDVHVGRNAWSSVAELGRKVQDWQLPENLKRQLDYATALSLTNLGKAKDAEPLWAKLAGDPKLAMDQRGYALFHLAEGARREKNMEKQFLYAQESVTMLVASGTHKERVKDLMMMLMDVTERAQRYDDALRWGLEYDKLITVDAPDWGPFRLRMANLYKRLGDRQTWKKVLEDVAKRKPGSLEARIAETAMATEKLEGQASQYTAPPL